MKTLTRNLIFIALSAVALFGAGSVSAAQWVSTHGTNAIVEHPDRTRNFAASFYYRGWGLDITEIGSQNNWVHASIPTFAKRQIKLINVQYYKQYQDATINQMDIYDGATLVHRVSLPRADAGWNTIAVDLGAFKTFNWGMGISMSLIPGPADTQFIIGGVSAYMQ